MFDSFPKDLDAGLQRPNWELNREKEYYKNHQRVQQKQMKEQQLQRERHQGVGGGTNDCDFVGGLTLKDVYCAK